MLRSFLSFLTAIGKWLRNIVFVYIIRFLSFVLSRIIIVVGIVAGIVAVLSNAYQNTPTNLTVVYHADMDPTRPNPRQRT